MPALHQRQRGWASVGLAAAAVMLGMTVGCSPAATGTSPTPTSAATGGTSDSGAASPAASTAAPPTTAPSPSAVTPSASPATSAAAATCHTSGLRIRFADDEGGGAAGSVYGTITFTNTAKLTCSLRGFPGVSYVGKGNGTQIGAAADHDNDTVSRVTLAPGKKAVATLRRTNAGNYASECHKKKVDGLRIYPPASTTSAFVKFPSTGCSNKKVHLLSVNAVNPG
jgi:Protein of unknown function (DUF4232)